MTFDATDHADLFNQPLLMIAGSNADTKYMTDEAMQKATGTADKKEVIIEGTSHIETDWKPEYVSQISDQLTQFFKAKL